jgi:multisubunit Na+/H+ antiporter MnhC subunit
MLLTLFIVAVLMIFTVGIYSLVVTRNLIRVVISLEVLTKGVTLLIILVGASGLNMYPCPSKASPYPSQARSRSR